MLQTLIEPLQYGFMQRSLIIAILVGIVCAIVGSYLMVQRLALLGDAISHSVLPGLAIAFILGANIFLGAFIAGVLSTVIIAWIKARSTIKEDAAMGIVFSAFFALGITLITIVQKDNKIDPQPLSFRQHPRRYPPRCDRHSRHCRRSLISCSSLLQRTAILHIRSIRGTSNRFASKPAQLRTDGTHRAHNSCQPQSRWRSASFVPINYTCKYRLSPSHSPAPSNDFRRNNRSYFQH